MRIAVLASGSGSNFEAIAQAIADKKIAGEIVLLFSDQPKAYVLERGKKFNVATAAFSLKDFDSKGDYETALLTILQEYQVELVVLAGYMRIVGKDLLAAFPNKIINIHPALLPNFPGMHGIADAFNAGVAETGVTVHYVDAGVDTGPIIAQGKVAITEEDTLASLEEKIHALEHQLYPQVINQVVQENQA
ncbi:phosphoribosylglycinamide formyltransferase-1 [Enterococcus sp. PF1-24]|uniref:phosphoribosylglycinamide formyltransferase n=1 Tax=unclassified Enterococcus TaxID=2608891 RepID=UPI0024747961|nr:MULTISPECIES: phosphoribosylglycinamide formyltransferase [unclassified Enterococcus]MDH6365206.1 phosphoribosylglycinamide formyltransferase-1 [Enterococcus sp. PFB1-1]MDH6402307.1 phosphoribosylglycinamide formyltransferase-1 [Enterococcus sp. PF1-24]